jgi:1-acyl-sn-glycerol-3-phosphate acyltransferase
MLSSDIYDFGGFSAVFRTIIFYLLFFPWTLLNLLVAIAISIRGQKAIHNVGIFWGKSCLRLAGLKLNVYGAKNIPVNQPVVYVSNHQSNFDIPILYAGLPLQFRWLAKQELFKIPLFGIAMKRSGYIPIDRRDRRKTMQSMNAAAKRIQEGASVIIFPEGTRSPNGKLQSFKKGALLLAIKAKVPIVPVTIRGSYQVQKKNSLRIHSSQPEVIFSPALDPSELAANQIDELTTRIYDQIAANLEHQTQ